MNFNGHNPVSVLVMHAEPLIAVGLAAALRQSPGFSVRVQGGDDPPAGANVLGLLARGQCNKSITRQLAIAVGTVKIHVKAIMGKLDASSRTQAASVAAQRGLIDRLAADGSTATRHLGSPRFGQRPGYLSAQFA